MCAGVRAVGQADPHFSWTLKQYRKRQLETRGKDKQETELSIHSIVSGAEIHR